jgi:ribosomal-protein-alanine N-acetyltransferase
MMETPMQTESLNLIPMTREGALAMMEALSSAERVHVSEDWLAQVHACASEDPWTFGFSMVLKRTDSPIGTCGFNGPPSEDGVVEIAYGVDPDHQGKGYATEAAEALVTFAFGSGLVRVVRAHTLPEPNASTRVLTNCGFLFLGEIIDPEEGLVWRWEKHNDVPA